jgi:putative nucleotidyltransferase-like protein
MIHRIELEILRYLRFQVVPSEDYALWRASETQWQDAVAFADTAGLTLSLLDRLKQRGDFSKLSLPMQRGLARRFQDNVSRTNVIGQELIELNRMLQTRSVRYLNLKGQALCPDFVARREYRLQYDHDFLIRSEDLQRAYALFFDLGYSPLPSSRRLAVGHLPTLVRKSGWKWQGNLFDPEIPLAVELHFQLWDPKFDKIPIRALDDVWENSISIPFLSFSIPVLSREHTLLYCVLHAFRHLLRNDLRLSHLYEIGYFLHNHSGQRDFWERFLRSIAYCSKSCRAAALIFELACRVFHAQVGTAVSQFVIEHLSPATAAWIEEYGVRESIYCYRRSKSAIFLHLDFVEGVVAKSTVTARKLIPRHPPLSSFGIHTPEDGQDRKFRSRKLLSDSSHFVQRILFHAQALVNFVLRLPFWVAKIHCRRNTRGMKPGERQPSVHPSAEA